MQYYNNRWFLYCGFPAKLLHISTKILQKKGSKYPFPGTHQFFFIFQMCDDQGERKSILTYEASDILNNPFFRRN